MSIYIRSSACLSPQKTFSTDEFLEEPVEYTGTRLRVIEPDYKQYIDPKLLRRMGPSVKRGIAAAKECLGKANVDVPGAIITGTAFGCTEDTVTFLTNVIEMEEKMLPPTAFIQSTHNTVAAQVALTLGCHEYNYTYVHKGISFESALFDAILLLKEEEAENILVAGIEELIDTTFKVLTRLGIYKRWPISNLSVLDTGTNGTIGGEGSVFFLLTDKPCADNLAELKGMKMFYKPGSIDESGQKIQDFLAEHSLQPDDIDLVITGRNGDTRNDAVYKGIIPQLFQKSSIANYKHLCGEYSTSSAFALWLAANIIKKGEVPEVVFERKSSNNTPKKILVYNHYQNKYHSLMLLSAV